MHEYYHLINSFCIFKLKKFFVVEIDFFHRVFEVMVVSHICSCRSLIHS